MEEQAVVYIAAQQVCYACQKARDLENALWAQFDLKSRGVCDPSKLSWEMLVGYGVRFYDSQKCCEHCSPKNVRIERTESA